MVGMRKDLLLQTQDFTQENTVFCNFEDILLISTSFYCSQVIFFLAHH